MTNKFQLFSLALAVAFLQGCNPRPTQIAYRLAESEKVLCDTLEIDTSIVQELRKYNLGRIEPFHYSLSKIIRHDSVIDAYPAYLKGLIVREQSAKSTGLVLQLKDSLRAKGYSIFLLENNFDIDHKPDRVAILKTADQFTVLKQVGTDGINYGISNDSLISIIKNFDRKYSLELIGASGDWCDFIINKEPADWMQFAEEVYKVCPDVVDQGAGSVQALADEMKRTKRLYFWWD